MLHGLYAQDCENAIRLTTDSVTGSAPSGWGSRLEFVGNPKESIHYIEKEHHTVWYEINIVRDCQFTFEILPDQVHDDYDFMLFKAEGENYCEDFRRKKTKPIRSNISRNNKLIKSRTGLKQGVHQTHIHSGKGDAYSNALLAKRGERYLLLIDNVYDHGKGYTLTTSPCVGEPVMMPQDTTPTLPQPKEQPLVVVKKPTPPLDEPPIKDLTDELEQGHSFTLDKVYFFGNSAVAVSKSRGQLDELVKFMETHKNSKITVNGHTNGQNISQPYFRPRKNAVRFLFAETDDQQFDGNLVKEFKASATKLSMLRAKTVKLYLVNQGISGKRITVKGWGDTQMIVDINARNSYINRRVEIELNN
jgi:outer membrane protein OmpA-like peptidoglycan-associated protein